MLRIPRFPWLLTGLLLWPFFAVPAQAASPEKEFEARQRALASGDASGWLALADFAQDNQLWRQRIEALAGAATADPGNARARRRLDQKLWNNAWLPAAEAEAAEILANRALGLVYYNGWVEPAEISRLRRAERREAGWDFNEKMRTAHFDIYSGQPTEITFKIADMLEKTVEAFGGVYAGVWRLNKSFRVKVFLFGDREMYAGIAEKVRGAPIADFNNGFYSSRERTIYIGIGRDGHTYQGQHRLAVLFHTARHEAAHAFAYVYAAGGGPLPIWVSEGLAEYLAYAAQGRQTLPGAIHVNPYDSGVESILGDISGVDPAELFSAGPGGMDTGSAQFYGLAWSFTYFLFHGEEKRYAEGFRRYLMQVDKSRSRDLEKCLGIKLSKLRPRYQRWLKAELLPAIYKSKSSFPGVASR